MSALVSYYGGKQKISSKIVSLIPKHNVYVEPFCGGAAVFWNKNFKSVNDRKYIEVLNDIDENIVNFYRVFQTKFEEIKHKLLFTPYSEAEYKKSKEILTNKNNEYNDLDRAWAYFVNIQQGFSRILKTGWARSLNINLASIWNNKLLKLNYFFKKMERVSISCEPALDCIKRYDSVDTFFYCDPPYPNSNQGYYKGYTLKDFQDLVDALSLIKGSFILSCYKNAAKIPKDFETFYIKTKMTVYNKTPNSKERTEILYRKINNGKAIS